MSWFASDIVALGCIIGGAAVGGAATLAVTDGGGDAHIGCGVESVAVSPKIAISHGGTARAFVVTPDVQVRALRDCGSSGVVEVHVDRHLDHLDAKLEHLDQTLEFQMEQLEHQLEHQIQSELADQMDIQVRMEEAMSRLEEAKIKMVVKRRESGGI